MSLVNPCSVAANGQNTGSECNSNLKATAMVFLVPKGLKIPKSTFTGTGAATTYFQSKIHAPKSSRIYVLFGNSAPIRSITDNKENDVIETLDDGSMQFIRFGMYNRTYVTTEGGLCLAQHLMSFIGSNYSFMDVDIIGQIQMMLNADNTFSGFPMNLGYPPTPELANLKTSYKNQYMVSFSPNTYIKKGYILSSDATEDILSLRGLIDTDVVPGTTTSTTTHLYVSVLTDCGQTDLVDLYGDDFDLTCVVVTNADGTANTPSAIAIVAASGNNPAQINLTGTFLTGVKVALAAPSALLAAGIEGYEGVSSATLTF